MPTIYLETYINAPIERVFDLARSIDLHKLSMKSSHEEAVGGRTHGLIGLGEMVSWRAKHLGVYQKLTIEITEYNRPFLFADKMLKGAFASMKHIHRFKEENKGTIMTDTFEFKAPLGLLGVVAERIFLKTYMNKLLLTRNAELKEIAETDQWKTLLN